MSHQIIRRFVSSAFHVCGSGRPALYKLQQKQQQQQKEDKTSAELSMVRLGVGQVDVRQIGEDAIMIHGDCTDGAAVTHASFFGVADGVGGWRDQGVDPGDASLALLQSCSSAFGSSTKPSASLKDLLSGAYADLLNSRGELIGSTTVCLARYTPESKLLEVANLGDSGLCVFNSQFQLRLRTRFQSNMGGVFNCPKQLAFPKALSLQYPKPEECDLYSIVLEPGDIVLMATDGLWDNLYHQTIEEIFKHAFHVSRARLSGPKTASVPENGSHVECQQSPKNPLEEAARILVDAATYLSAEQGYFSPFCQSAKEAGLKYVGGKEDDISVILARFCPTLDDDEPMSKL